MGHKQKKKMSVKSVFCVKNSCVRKALCLALLFLLALPVSALASSVEPTTPNEVPGDIDNSRSVDLADVILALQVSAKITLPTTTTIKIEADVNNDGKIGLEEAIYALQVVSGIRSQ